MHEPIDLPPDVSPYGPPTSFDERTLPAPLRTEHATLSGIWVVIEIVSGSATYVDLDAPSETVLSSGDRIVVSPMRHHRLQPGEHMRATLQFYRHPEADPAWAAPWAAD